MANPADIEAVRRNTNESTSDVYSDSAIGVLVDAIGVSGASATIWREKASRFATLVDVTESGASHKYSDLHKNALAMSKVYSDADVTAAELTAGYVQVKKIVRS